MINIENVNTNKLSRTAYEDDRGINRQFRNRNVQYNNGRPLESSGRTGQFQRNAPFGDKPRHKLSHNNDINENVDYLYGIQPILLALQVKRRLFHELICQESFISDDEEEVNSVDNTSNPIKKPKRKNNERELILQLCSGMNIPVSYISKHDMNLRADHKPHQGFILVTSKLTFAIRSWKALPACTDPFK